MAVCQLGNVYRVLSTFNSWFFSALVGLSFSGAIGLTFLLLGCGLEQYG